MDFSDAGTWVVIVIVFFVSVVLTRWIFSIGRQLKNQKAIIFLLMKLCVKQGDSKEEIEKIRKYFDIDFGASEVNTQTL